MDATYEHSSIVTPSYRMGNVALVKGLRELADFIESHPEMKRVRHSPFNIWGITSAEQLRAETKGFGLMTKEVLGGLFYLRKSFSGDVKLEFNIDRKLVCERVVKDRIVKPAMPARTVELEATPETVEEVIEWVCPESILHNE